MGLQVYQLIIIVSVLFGLIMLLAAFIKKRRAKKQEREARPVSTVQAAYYAPAQYAQYPNQNGNNYYANGTAIPVWSTTALDASVASGVNIRQPASGAVIVTREPVLLAQNGYSSPYGASSVPQPIQHDAYVKPPPYNPGFQYSVNN